MLKLAVNEATFQKAAQQFSPDPPYAYQPPPGKLEQLSERFDEWNSLGTARVVFWMLLLAGVNSLAFAVIEAKAVGGLTLAEVLTFFIPQADLATRLFVAPLVVGAITVLFLLPLTQQTYEI
jgi:hypothetical protein